MSEFMLHTSMFPSVGRLIQARWAPILLEPIVGSYERLVVGVAVVSGGGFHVEAANALERLRCLYADNAERLIFAIQLSLEHLPGELARVGVASLPQLQTVTSNITVGEWREAEGVSLQRIGDDWLRALSSLHRDGADLASLALELAANDDESALSSRRTSDQLPALVFGYVEQHRMEMAQFFSQDIRRGVRRRPAARAHEVTIDFSGTRLTANFGTLRASQIGTSVGQIKRRLWDLKVDRDRASSPGRSHEMILQVPRLDDPQFTGRQHDQIGSALQGLETQADQEELRLRPLRSVDEIGAFLLEREAA